MTLSTSTQQTFEMICKKIHTETHDVKTFIFTYPHSQSPRPFSYQAGQHINFSFNIGGKEHHCCYTLSSSPTKYDFISITIKRIPGGLISNYFHDHFQVGQSIIVKNANGKFYLPEPSPPKILLLSAGSGITPMLSMLRFMVESHCKNQVIFLHSAHTEADLIARNEIRDLAKQHGRCKVVYTLTQTVEPNWQGFQGRITEQMFRGIPQLTSYHVFTCGPKLFRQTAQQIFQALSLPRNHYHFESFGERNNLRQNDIIDTIESTNKMTAPMPKTSQTNQQKKKVSIHFSRWNKTYQGNTKESLLEQGESAGLILPSSCRGGSCGSCKAKLISGEVKQSSTDGLSVAEQQQGYILLCSCHALTDVELSHE
jgi:ferredoxin-NADP reductase